MLLGLPVVLLAAVPERAAWGVALALITAVWPVAHAWKAARGTALRPALGWALASIVVGLGAQVWAGVEPLESGRPGAGHLAYLSTLAMLSALISVLNARAPGGGAWGILMGLLVLVFLIPWLEGPGLLRDPAGLGRLRLSAPWTWFYGLLVVAGVTNFLPTRYALSAIGLAAGLVIELLGLTHAEWTRAQRPGLVGRSVDLGRSRLDRLAPRTRPLCRIGFGRGHELGPARADVALVPRSVGRGLGPPRPGPIQPGGRGGPMALASELVRGRRRSRTGVGRSIVDRRGDAPRPAPPVRPPRSDRRGPGSAPDATPTVP